MHTHQACLSNCLHWRQQVTGIDYNQKVDIYSLGVIFYEMNHAFPTEMERTKVLGGRDGGGRGMY